jgi:hypothetical protein
MKKVIFTAIAMIAFSSASMANTIADEEVVTENNKKAEVENVAKLHPCVFVGFAAADQAEADGLSPQQVLNAANTAYAVCLVVTAFGG